MPRKSGGGGASYEVGYGKPPVHTRFQKGHCPNPKGRPRKADSLEAARQRVLLDPLTVTQNGRRTKVTAYEAMLLQLRARALGGDLKAMTLLLKVVAANGNGMSEPFVEPSHAAPEPEPEPLPLDDEALIERYLTRKDPGGLPANEDRGGEDE